MDGRNRKVRLIFGGLLTLVTLCGAFIVQAQTPAVADITVESWKKGDAKVDEKKISVRMDEGGYAFDLFDSKRQKKYRLSIRKIYVPTIRKPNPQCVLLELHETFLDDASGGVFLGPNLLVASQPMQTSANLICPIERPIRPLDISIYPAYAKRIFFIESFAVELRALDFAYDHKENSLDQMTISVHFRNSFINDIIGTNCRLK
ncbi:MAG: hypothetical protein R2682_12960 [Pyrinomonadaceae bacterium]